MLPHPIYVTAANLRYCIGTWLPVSRGMTIARSRAGGMGHRNCRSKQASGAGREKQILVKAEEIAPLTVERLKIGGPC